jgi:RNA-directed DNA polymerase
MPERAMASSRSKKLVESKLVQTGRPRVARGEAARLLWADEACCLRHKSENTGSAQPEAALTRENLKHALLREMARLP